MVDRNWRWIEGKKYITTQYTHFHGTPVGDVTVPPAFPFEVSVPPWLEWAVDPHDPVWLWAALLHDWLLEKMTFRVPVDVAAAVLREMLKEELQEGRWRIWPAWFLVLLWTVSGHTIKQAKGYINGGR